MNKEKGFAEQKESSEVLPEPVATKIAREVLLLSLYYSQA